MFKKHLFTEKSINNEKYVEFMGIFPLILLILVRYECVLVVYNDDRANSSFFTIVEYYSRYEKFSSC